MKRIFLLLLLLLPGAAQALVNRIEIAIPADNTLLADLAGGVQHALQQLQPALPIVVRIGNSNSDVDTQNTLLISIGDALLPWANTASANYAATLAFNVNSNNPLSTSRSDKFSALYRDQPLARQLQLIRLLLPNARRVGIIQSHRELPQSIVQLQRGSDLIIQAIDIEDKPDWPKLLSQLMLETDVLLGIEDPTIYNGDTIRSILLTTYRRGDFLIGPGRAFVNAGSLASCYTPPDEYLKQLMAMVSHLLRTQQLPPPQYPRAFRVAVNPQVATSLGLAIQDENTLTARLQMKVQECGDGC